MSQIREIRFVNRGNNGRCRENFFWRRNTGTEAWYASKVEAFPEPKSNERKVEAPR